MAPHRPFIKAWLILSLICLLGAAAEKPEAAEIFVSPSGDDATGTGSESAPFASPNRALQAAVSGDIITLREGTYSVQGVRVEVPNVTLRSFPGEWAAINCPNMEEVTVDFRLGSDGSRLERLELSGGYYVIKTESNWDWGGPIRCGASNITVTDCQIHSSADACVKITPGSDDIIFERCEIYNSGLTEPGSAEGIDNVNGDRMTVRQCYIHDIRGAGLYAKGGAMGMVVDRCLIANCDSGGVMVGFDTSPEWFDLEANPDYYENIDGTVTNCIIVNTQYAGIGIYAAVNAQVYNNTLVNTAQEGHSALYFGLTFQDWEPQATRPPSVNPILRNNIVVNTGPAEATAVEIRYSDELGGMSALSGMPQMSNNIYHWTTGSARFVDDRPDSSLAGDLAQWQAHLSGEAGSQAIDPLLDADYHLLPGSPAIDAGYTWTSQGQTTSDYDGQLRVEPFDIGADEYSPGG
ncbi:MAG: right-handed parallel beta-helix repeat-containing protein [Deltaproteobacteria bacterium]|nr:right-handed parallel beta-helix repeat-containing protein [Deltaproteobacteria bacterium]